MSDTEAPETPPRESHATPARDRRSLAIAVAAILALIAIGLSAWALLRPAPGSEGSFSDSQHADAKAKVCAAFEMVRRGVNVNTSLSVPGGPDDQTGTLAVAANARLSLYNGGLYLMDRLDPATPKELADTVSGFANVLMDIGAAATAGTPDSDPDQAARLKDADATNTKISEMCAK